MVRKALSALIIIAIAALPSRAGAGVSSQGNPPTAPCYAAAVASLTKRGAIYSQGGYLPDDPIDPATGKAYPRTGPTSYDCSGLVWWAYAQAGVAVGSTTYQQVNNGWPISCTIDDLHGPNSTCWTVGDLLFLRYPQGQHVVIYAGDGIFMGCENYALGCITQDVSANSFYRRYFWQARRIVSGCEAARLDPGTPGAPGAGSPETPLGEQIPDLVTPVQLVLPWVDPDTGTIIGLAPIDAPAPGYERWYDLGAWFVWLAAQLWNLLGMQLTIWQLTAAQGVLNIAQGVINLFVVPAINAVWHIYIKVVLWFNGFLLAMWLLFESVRLLLWNIWSGFAQLYVQLGAYLDLVQFLIRFLADLLGYFLDIVTAIIQIIEYIIGFLFTLLPAMFTALSNPLIPPELEGITENILFVMFSDTVRAIADSKIGWVWYAFIAFYYLRFVLWVIDESSDLNS